MWIGAFKGSAGSVYASSGGYEECEGVDGETQGQYVVHGVHTRKIRDDEYELYFPARGEYDTR